MVKNVDKELLIPDKLKIVPLQSIDCYNNLFMLSHGSEIVPNKVYLHETQSFVLALIYSDRKATVLRFLFMIFV